MEELSAIQEIIRTVIPLLDSVPAIRVLLGFILVFFLPGFAWTLIFFSGRQINTVERLALSFGLSIAIVTLSIFALNRLIGIRITGVNAFLIIIAITIVPLAFYYLKKLMRKSEVNDE